MKERRMPALLILVCMMISLLSVTAMAYDIPTGYEFEEVGTFDEEETSFNITTDGVVYNAWKDGDTTLCHLYNYLGEQIMDEDLIDVHRMKGVGYYVRAASDSINSAGLVTDEGEILIPCEAAMIKTVSDPVKYLEVIYATEEVESEDDAFFYVTDRIFALQPEDEDVFYAGYAKIYDVENKAFLEGVEVDNPSRNAVNVCGDYVAVSDREDVLTVYDDSGKAVFTASAEDAGIGNGFVVTRDSDGSRVFDVAENEEIYSIDTRVYALGDYIKIYNSDDSSWTVAKPDGTPVLENVNSIDELVDGILDCEIEKGVSSLVDIETGEVLHTLADKDKKDAGYSYMEGFWMYRDEDSVSYLIDWNGKEHKMNDGLDGIINHMTACNKDDKGTDWFVMTDQDFTLRIENSSSFAGTVLVTENDNWKYGLYETITGRQLLPCEYSSIRVGEDFIFAYKDREYTVYTGTILY